MAGEWKRTMIADVIDLISGGTPKTSTSGYWGGNIPWLSVADFNTGYRWVSAAEKTITDLGLSESATAILNRGDIIISARGTVGVVAQLAKPMAFNQSCYGIRGKQGIAETDFVYYALRHAVSGIKQVAYGGIFDTITRDTFRIIEIGLPPLVEQRAIAHILGTLDDKIELNRRMNETLEAMAQAIFKSWFVDFDPARAKSKGRDPGLPKDIADLFPDSFEDSELGEIPAGWELCRVGDIGSVVCGKTPSTQVSEYYGHDVPFITIPDMHGKIFATMTQKWLSRAGVASQQNKMLPGGAICVSCIATPGLAVITSEEAQTNQQINTVVPSRIHETYFWFWPLRNLGDEIRAGGSGGSVLTNLSTGRFAELRVQAPPARLRSFYHLLVTPLFNCILANENESRTLAAIRDALLPKLLLGRIRTMTPALNQ